MMISKQFLCTSVLLRTSPTSFFNRRTTSRRLFNQPPLSLTTTIIHKQRISSHPPSSSSQVPPLHSPPATTPEETIVRFIRNMWQMRSLSAFVQLGVPDLLKDNQLTVAYMAQQLNVSHDGLLRLLRAVAYSGVVSYNGTDDTFGLTTPLGQVLRSDHPRSMGAALMISNFWIWQGWGKLDQAVITGNNVTADVTGMEGWEFFKQNPWAASYFSRAMDSYSALSLRAVMRQYKFDGAQLVVDVGGSNGSFVKAVLESVPTARGIIFDLPPVVVEAAKRLKGTALESRISTVGGSFLCDPVPQGGDVYLLKHILHSWNDEDCIKILVNLRNGMKQGSVVVVVEELLTEEEGGGVATLMDLQMFLVFTGGKERTLKEYEVLFRKAGLNVKEVHKTQTYPMFGIMVGELAGKNE